MVKLTDDYLSHQAEFEKAGIAVPQFDQQKAAAAAKQPIWVHFGGGNLFRGFHAAIAQHLLDQGLMQSGVIVGETYDDQVPASIYAPYQNRVLQVVMPAGAPLKKTLIASVAKAIYYSRSNPAGWQAMAEVFAKPSLQLVTLSITEKGYALTDGAGNLSKAAQADMQNDPETATTNMGALARLLLVRFKAGKFKLAMVSTDNFSQNGQRLEDGILTIAKGWVKNGLVPQAFVDYLSDKQFISFPWTMIDRITPNPAESVAKDLQAAGFEDTQIVHTPKHTNIAPFANTEATHYLVIQDCFPNGRPPLEKAGVILTSRETVNDADQMKVTALLNPLHTGLAIFGCLLGYQSIAVEMGDPDLVKLVRQLGYHEDLPMVKDPQIIDPKQFLDEVVEKRLPNKQIPDTPQRIATDTSQKLAVRYGVTLRHYAKAGKDLSQLKAIPLILAGWLRYLLAVDDQGASFTPSPDPLYAEFSKQVAGLKLGESADVPKVLQPILSNRQLFGVDLQELGLAPVIERHLAAMLKGPGAVRAELHQL